MEGVTTSGTSGISGGATSGTAALRLDYRNMAGTQNIDVADQFAVADVSLAGDVVERITTENLLDQFAVTALSVTVTALRLRMTRSVLTRWTRTVRPRDRS